MLAGKTISLTEELIRTLSGEQLEMVRRQLSRPEGTPSPSPSAGEGTGTGTGTTSPVETPMGKSGLEGILFSYGDA